MKEVSGNIIFPSFMSQISLKWVMSILIKEAVIAVHFVMNYIHMHEMGHKTSQDLILRNMFKGNFISSV